MKIHFLGANRQVTGSRYCLETDRSRVLIDCGMFQERHYEARNWNPSPVEIDSLDAVVITHAHIDHCGLLPRLVQQGYADPIYATPPTVELLEIMLRDAAKIQSEDVAYKRRRHEREQRRSRYPVEPLFDDNDVDRLLPLRRRVDLDTVLEVTPDIQLTFRDAGHILGSAMLEFHVQEGNRNARIVFSGDIGQRGKPILHDPTVFTQADYVVMESTYGDRDHERMGEIEQQFEQVIQRTIARGGNVVIPTFAVERAQELMYYISHLVYEDRIPDVQIFLDSPMAVDVTELFHRYRDLYDEEAWRRVADGRPPMQFPGLKLCRSTESSMAINQFDQPCIIMSTSGMCTAGRIKHHLRRNLPRKECTILFVGFQAEETLGRQILEGRSTVRIHGQDYPVRAEIAQIYGFSGHADRQGLLDWAGHFQQAPRHVFLTHGEESSALSLANQLRTQFHWTVSVPQYLSVSDLT